MSDAIVVLRKFIDNDANVKSALDAMPGKRGGSFANSLINLVRNTNKLQKCKPGSVMTAALVAASMNLAIDPALGYAAIVPYGDQAQFQLMYKGLIQLCIRSGKYETIHATEVYKDELKFHDHITCETEFTELSKRKMRDTGNLEDIAGYYARFKLLSGFVCQGFITHAGAMSHAKKFSKAYQYDVAKSKKSSVWSTDPVAMGTKTILKAILTKYGIMSIEMQDAIVADHVDTTYEGVKNLNDDIVDDKDNNDIIEADVLNDNDQSQEKSDNWETGE